MTVSTYLYDLANKCGNKSDEAMLKAINATDKAEAVAMERDMREWAHLSFLFAKQANEFHLEENE